MTVCLFYLNFFVFLVLIFFSKFSSKGALKGLKYAEFKAFGLDFFIEICYYLSIQSWQALGFGKALKQGAGHLRGRKAT